MYQILSDGRLYSSTEDPAWAVHTYKVLLRLRPGNYTLQLAIDGEPVLTHDARIVLTQEQYARAVREQVPGVDAFYRMEAKK